MINRQQRAREAVRRHAQEQVVVAEQKRIKVESFIYNNKDLLALSKKLPKLSAAQAGPAAIMITFESIGVDFEVSYCKKEKVCAWCQEKIVAESPIYLINIPRPLKLPPGKLSWKAHKRALRIHPECLEHALAQLDTIKEGVKHGG